MRMAASKLITLNPSLVSLLQGPFSASHSPASPRAARLNPALLLPTLDPSGKSRLEPPLHSKRRRVMNIILNPLLMPRTPSSFSLNALLIINGLLVERERKKSPPLYSFGLVPPRLFFANTAAAGTRKRNSPAYPFCCLPCRSCSMGGMGREKERRRFVSILPLWWGC